MAAMATRVIFRKHGEPDVLEVETFTPAAVGPGQLGVDVAFCGINFGDCVARRGFYKAAPPPPACVGFEASGVVHTVGAGVTDFAVGDRVLCMTRFGGYASQLVVATSRARKLPDGMSLEHAAALPAVYITAWHCLVHVARARAGEHLLIQAVAGGVGLAALQLGKHLGLVTYGTASSPAKLDVARGFGLDHGIDYSKTDFEVELKALTGGRGVDIVLDSLGGEAFAKGYRSLARGGQIIAIGAAQVAPNSRNPLELIKAGRAILRGGSYRPLRLVQDNRGMHGVQILYWWDDDAHVTRAVGELLRLYAQGVVRPVIDGVTPFSQAHRAHARLESRASTGKLLLRPD